VKGYLLDTNILSELRKRERGDVKVIDWFHSVPEEKLFLSVLVLGEVRKGIELVRRRDPIQAQALEAWLSALETTYEQRLLTITASICDRWGRLSALRPISAIDSLMAATALENSMVLVTRNTDDFQHTGVPLLNPFS
jgi:predicted nucleic acid-binding protein